MVYVSKSLLYIPLLFIAAQGLAQARISARLDSTRIYIGNTVKMHITIQAAENASISAPKNLPDSSAIILLDSIKTARSARNGDQIYTQTWTLTALDSGQFVVPPMPYTCRTNGTTDTLYTQPLTLFAQPTLVDTTQVSPIAPIMEEAFWWSDMKYWLLALLLAATGIFIYIKIKNRTKTSLIKNETAPESHLSADEWAKKELQKLEKQGLLQQNEHKKHYVILSTIFRTYIEKRYKTPVLEKTSEEVLFILEQKTENWILHEPDIRQFLQTADLVKFAKASTTTAQDSQFLKAIHIYIDSTPATEKHYPRDAAGRIFIQSIQ
jgi:BatD DUF11 like domain